MTVPSGLYAPRGGCDSTLQRTGSARICDGQRFLSSGHTLQCSLQHIIAPCGWTRSESQKVTAVKMKYY
jgi:hypothetical protein